MEKGPRRQCAKCPWREGVDPREIPGGYCELRHAALARTVAEPGALPSGPELRMMACHEAPPGRELPCVGWLANQLGPGNNVALRLAVVRGRVDADVRTVGPQRARFEDTLPGPRPVPVPPCGPSGTRRRGTSSGG